MASHREGVIPAHMQNLSIPAAAGLVVANFLFWGHWPVCARFASIPSQPFGVLMVVTQTCIAWIACCMMGTPFFDALVADSAHPLAVLSVVAGGAALAIGDFSAAAAIEHLGIAVGGPVCFSCMLICGSIGDFALEGSAHPTLLFSGIAGCICAVLADSQSHASHSTKPLSKADSAAGGEMEAVGPTTSTQTQMEMGSMPHTKAACKDLPAVDATVLDVVPDAISATKHAGAASFRLGMVVAVAGGCIGGMWTVLSTLASHAHPLDPFVLLFYFHLGEVLFIVPVVLSYGKLFGGETSAAALVGMIRSLTRRQTLWTAAAGGCIALGYLCYFATKSVVPRPVAYAFGCAAGSTGMLYGLLVFKEYAGAAPSKKMLLLAALVLYPGSIALIAASMGPK